MLVQFLLSVPGETLLLDIEYLISSSIRGVVVVLNATHRSELGSAGHSDLISLADLSAITLTDDGG